MVHMILGPLVGGLIGFAYHRFIGCSGGSCPIVSNPWISTLFGAVMGLILAGSSGSQ